MTAHAEHWSPEVRQVQTPPGEPPASTVTVLLDPLPPPSILPALPCQVAEGSPPKEPMVQTSIPAEEVPQPTSSLDQEEPAHPASRSGSKSSERAPESALDSTVQECNDEVPEFLEPTPEDVVPAVSISDQHPDIAVAVSEPEGPSSVQPITTASPVTSTSTREATQPPAESEIKESIEHDGEAVRRTSAEDGPAPTIAETTEGINFKALPKVAAGATVQAGQAYVAASMEAQGTIRALLSLREKEGPPVTLTVEQIVVAAFLALVLLQLLIMLVFLPSAFRLVYSLGCGLLFGLGLSFLFYQNKGRKAEINGLLATNLGIKGVQLVAAGLPSHFNVSEIEKMEWLNAFILEMWPFVDKAVCEKIKEVTAQTMPNILRTLPPALAGLVQSVSFKHLTFGSAPVRIESIWVDAHDKENLAMELSIKWCGDPNITLAIELPGGQKLCPRIMDITLVAHVRLLFGPLVSRLPGFVCMVITMPKSPMVNYRLDFGKAMGGSMAPVVVTPVINYFIRDVVDKMLVWPARLVVPILLDQPSDAVAVQKLMRRQQGLLRVQVVRGKELEDLGPFDRCMVELTTDSEYHASTSIQSPVLPPGGPEAAKKLPTGPVMFGDTVHLLIQEPRSQMLRLEVFDLTAGHGGRSMSMSGRRLVGRAMVKLSKVCKAGAKGDKDQQAVTTQLGKANWGNPGGPGKGCGKVSLRLTYIPFEQITQEQVLAATKGILTVRILGLRNVIPVGTDVTVYVAVNTTAGKAAGRPSWHSPLRKWTQEGHIANLRRRIKVLQAQQQEAENEGREEDARRLALKVADLNMTVEGRGASTSLVHASWQLESFALHVLYDVEDKMPDGSDNKVLFKVIREGKAVRSNQAFVGEVAVPVAQIRAAKTYNALTGAEEQGLWFPGNPQYFYRPVDDDFDDSDWGLQLGQDTNTRVMAVVRYVPCIPSPENDLPDDDDDDDINAATDRDEPGSPPPPPPPPPPTAQPQSPLSQVLSGPSAAPPSSRAPPATFTSGLLVDEPATSSTGPQRQPTVTHDAQQTDEAPKSEAVKAPKTVTFSTDAATNEAPAPKTDGGPKTVTFAAVSSPGGEASKAAAPKSEPAGDVTPLSAASGTEPPKSSPSVGNPEPTPVVVPGPVPAPAPEPAPAPAPAVAAAPVSAAPPAPDTVPALPPASVEDTAPVSAEVPAPAPVPAPVPVPALHVASNSEPAQSKAAEVEPRGDTAASAEAPSIDPSAVTPPRSVASSSGGPARSPSAADPPQRLPSGGDPSPGGGEAAKTEAAQRGPSKSGSSRSPAPAPEIEIEMQQP